MRCAISMYYKMLTCRVVNITQLVGCLPNIHEALWSMLSTTYTGHSGLCLESKSGITWDTISINIETKNVYLYIYLVFSFWIMDKSFNSSTQSVKTKITAMSSTFHGTKVTAALGNSEMKGQCVASFDWHYSYHLTVGFREDRIAQCFILSSEASFPTHVVFEVLTGYFPCI